MAQKAPTESPNTNVPASARKRQQITHSNRIMFLWVAGASIIVAFSVVGTIFLTKQLIFNQKVIIETTKTADILKNNIDNAKKLDKEVNKLRADPSLSSVPSSGTAKSNNLDKILDALPYEGDWVGLGSSLQTSLLSGIAVNALSVDSTSTADALSSGVDLNSFKTVGDVQPISFNFKASGTDAELKTLLVRLDHSIRPIKITNMKLESGGPNKIDATIQAITYYQPKKTFELGEKAVKP
jgi:hypothetical protein